MGNNRLFPGIDHRQSIGTQHVPSVIWALYSVGETTTGVVVFLLPSSHIIPMERMMQFAAMMGTHHHLGDVLYDT